VECDPSASIAAISLALEGAPFDALIGPWCSDDCESAAYLMGGRHILQVSYSCKSALLSNRAKFPTFVRTTSTYRAAIPAIVSFSSWAGWKKMVILSSSDGVNALAAQELAQALRIAFIQVTLQLQIAAGIVTAIIADRVRVIVVVGSNAALVVVAVAAQTKGISLEGWAFLGLVASAASEDISITEDGAAVTIMQASWPLVCVSVCLCAVGCGLWVVGCGLWVVCCVVLCV
jgi:ABC-type branched-subunit amino acid transport system substrate-binding protein